MKTIIKISILCAAFLLVLFLWQEFPDWSTSSKINAEKVSSFFTAISALLTAVTVFLLYKQIKEQIEDRKASSKPDLYPEDQFFSMAYDKLMPKLKRNGKDEGLNGLISLHNIGFGVAKEIRIEWQFNKDILAPLVDSSMRELYVNNIKEDKHSFILANKQLEIQLPLIYISSLSFFRAGWTEMIWEELFFKISYKDIHDFQYPSKTFKVTVYVASNYVAFRFTETSSIKLSNEATMRSVMWEGDKSSE